jgi:hypothetical protein
MAHQVTMQNQDFYVVHVGEHCCEGLAGCVGTITERAFSIMSQPPLVPSVEPVLAHRN